MGWMWKALRSGPPDPGGPSAASGHEMESGSAFAVDSDSIPPSVVGVESYASSTSAAPRVSRREAIQVAAVKRSRDLVCGSLGGLQLVTVNADLTTQQTSWLQQPERTVPRSVTMTRLVEDLFFEQVAWWRKVETDYRNFPLFVERLKPGRVNVNQDTGKVYVDGRHVPDDKLIRFDSPNDGLLIAGARAIRQCLLLDRAVQRNADGAPPLDYLTPGDDVVLDDDEVTEILDKLLLSRQKRVTGYIPADLKYNTAGWNPEQLQLAEQRQNAVLDIARIAGVDPEELGVSTTSRTYANQFDRRKAFLDFTLGAYRAAIEDRLSMGDCTPRGTTVRFDLDGFLRSSAKERFEAYKLGLEVGAIAEDEIRPAEGKPQIPAAARLTPAPAQLRAVPSEESA